MSAIHENAPCAPSTPPEKSAHAGALDGSQGVGELPDATDGAPVEPLQHARLSHRSAHGLRLAFVVAESGDEVWYAVCVRHGWLSLGGSHRMAEEAICTCCLADVETHARRGVFLRSYGSVVLAALFRGEQG